MDKILDIDEKNMFAIVEPYVICAQLQAEAMKRGLNINIIGAGCSTSVVASACAYFGGGPSSYYNGNNSDNLLGQEWVTPSGEDHPHRLAEFRRGWFCSEGPGPSVRAITRGYLGSRGGLGTFTKCAIKLSRLARTDRCSKPKGPPPGYRLPIPENFRAYTIGAPSWDAWANCYYKIYDNGIGYIFHRQFNLAGADLATALWLTYIDPDQDDERRGDRRQGSRRLARSTRGAHLVPVHHGRRRLKRGHRASGQDPGRHPRGRPAATR